MKKEFFDKKTQKLFCLRLGYREDFELFIICEICVENEKHFIFPFSVWGNENILKNIC